MSDRLEDKIVALCGRDPRYAKNAYFFVLDALEHTMQDRPSVRSSRNSHIGGRDLLEGIREVGRERFGPMAKEVFNQWGILSTEDFGQVVFNLISIGLLQRRPQDSIQDFADGYDFERVFEQDYRVAAPWQLGSQ